MKKKLTGFSEFIGLSYLRRNPLCVLIFILFASGFYGIYQLHYMIRPHLTSLITELILTFIFIILLVVVYQLIKIYSNHQYKKGIR